jgi:glycosyltransferase involved in cell wall biosynthesis
MKPRVPIVSVIIPTYKRPTECVRAVRSVLLQTFQNFEIIVGDDFGSDQTEALLLELNDPRIRYFRNGDAGGSACKNRNLCVSRSRGICLTFLDSDDFMLPCRLEMQVAALEGADESVGFVIAGTRVIRVCEGKYHFCRDLIPSAEGDLREAYFTRRLNCYNTSMMIRRSVLSAVGDWDHQMEPYDDAELILRLMSHTGAARIENILTIWFDHDGECLTNDREKRLTGLESFMNKHADLLEPQDSWWQPRLEKLLLLLFLSANPAGFRRWERRLRGKPSVRIKLLCVLIRFPLAFKVAGKLWHRWLTFRGRGAPSTPASKLVVLLPDQYRRALAEIL